MSLIITRRLAALLLATTALVSFAGAARAADTWIGAKSPDWSDLANWSLGSVPVASDDVIIDTTANANPLVGPGVNAVGNLLTVGDTNAGQLDVAGGYLVTDAGVVGLVNGSHGSVTIEGTGYSWTTTNDLDIARFGTGDVLVKKGGGLSVGGSLDIGEMAGASGQLTLSGLYSFASVAQTATIGLNGAGRLEVLDGNFSSHDLVTSTAGTTQSAILVDGIYANLNVTNNATIGQAGASTMTVSNGAHVSIGGDTLLGTVVGANGILTVDGNATLATLQNDLYVGSTGSGVLTVSNGAALTANDIFIGVGATGRGDINIGANGMDPAAAAGSLTAASLQFATGGGRLVFNHTSDALTFGTNITSANAASSITQLAGHTILTGNNAGFTGTTGVSGGTLSVNGSLSGTVTVTGGTLGGSGTLGTVQIASGGTLAPGNSIGTLNVTNADFGAGSTYVVEINDAGQSDLVNATGAITIDPAASVRVTLENGTAITTGFAAPIQYTIATAAGGVTGSFGSVYDDYAFITPSLSYDANNVFLTMIQDKLFETGGTTANQIATGQGADSTAPSGPLYGQLALLSSAEAPAALDALSGEGHASVKGLLIEQSAGPRNLVLRRLGYAGDGPDFWGDVFGGYAALAGDGNAAAASGVAGGLAGGVDAMLGDVRLGVLLHAGRSGYSIADRATTAGVAEYGAGVYGSASAGGVRLDFGGLIGRNEISTTRMPAFGAFAETLTSQHGATLGQAFGEASLDIDTGAVTISPFAGLSHVVVASDGFAETGGSAALSVGPDIVQATFTTLGIDLAQKDLFGDGSVAASARVAWQHGFMATPTSRNSFAGGAPFTVSGAPLATDALLLGGQLDVALATGQSLALSYDGTLASGAQSHQASLTLSGHF